MMPTPRSGSGRGRRRRRQRQFAALRPVPVAVQLEAASSLLNRAPLFVAGGGGGVWGGFVAGAVVLVWRVLLAGLVLQVPAHHLLDRLLRQDLRLLHLRLIAYPSGQDAPRRVRACFRVAALLASAFLKSLGYLIALNA